MASLLFIFILTLMAFVIAYSEAKVRHESANELLRSRDSTRSSLLKSIAEEMEFNGIEVRIDTLLGLLSIPEEVLFPSGSAELTGSGDNAIQVLATVLSGTLPCYSSAKWTFQSFNCQDSTHSGTLEAVFVEGHTDSQPVAKGRAFRDNWDLSALRSINSYKRMVEYGPILDSLTNRHTQKIFGVSGYADQRPRAGNELEENRRKNRRIDLRFIMTPPLPNDGTPSREIDLGT